MWRDSSWLISACEMKAGPRIALLKSRRLSHELGGAHDGGSVHVVKQLEALVAGGAEIDLFTRNEAPGEAALVETLPGFRLWRVPFSRSSSQDLFIRDFEEGRSFVGAVLSCPGFSASSFDAVILHHWTSGVDIGDSLPEGLPLLFTPHLLASEKAAANGLALPDTVAKIERDLLGRADCTIAMSRDEERSCVRLGARHVERVANGVSEAFFDLPVSARPDPGGIVKLGSVGRLCTQKGTEILLEAVAQLVVYGVDARLDVVGSSYGEDAFEAELERRLLDPRLAGRVRMLGPVAHQELPAIIASWDLYIQPSRYESQGIALLEAMAAARYVISTGLPAVREFLDERGGRLVATPPTAQSVALEIREALRDPSWGNRVEAAREAARPYRWDATTKSLQLCIDEAIRSSQWHGPDEQRRLSKAIEGQAQAIADKIGGGGTVAGILLLGSGARGAAKPGSDIDLLVVSDDLQESRQDWNAASDRPRDIRWEPTGSVLHMCDLSDEDFAELAADHPLVDYLSGARPLTELRPDLADAISLLLRRRFAGPVQTLIARRMLAQGAVLFDGAERLARDAAPADAQLKVNAGAQLLLQAAMVRLGWTVQGAKRRPEAAVTYARGSCEVRRAAAFLTSAVGIDGVTRTQAAEIVAARMRIRDLHFSSLESLGVAGAELERARRHSGDAADYYSATIATGYLKGCINHIRSFSGVPLMPNIYTDRLQLNTVSPAEAFLGSNDVPAEMRSLWQKVMEPGDAETLTQIAVEGATLATELAATS
jgi:D-inositol-3-phosphate glycosyltransferase